MPPAGTSHHCPGCDKSTGKALKARKGDCCPNHQYVCKGNKNGVPAHEAFVNMKGDSCDECATIARSMRAAAEAERKKNEKKQAKLDSKKEFTRVSPTRERTKQRHQPSEEQEAERKLKEKDFKKKQGREKEQKRWENSKSGKKEKEAADSREGSTPYRSSQGTGNQMSYAAEAPYGAPRDRSPPKNPVYLPPLVPSSIRVPPPPTSMSMGTPPFMRTTDRRQSTTTRQPMAAPESGAAGMRASSNLRTAAPPPYSSIPQRTYTTRLEPTGYGYAQEPPQSRNTRRANPGSFEQGPYRGNQFIDYRRQASERPTSPIRNGYPAHIPSRARNPPPVHTPSSQRRGQNSSGLREQRVPGQNSSPAYREVGSNGQTTQGSRGRTTAPRASADAGYGPRPRSPHKRYDSANNDGRY